VARFIGRDFPHGQEERLAAWFAISVRQRGWSVERGVCYRSSTPVMTVPSSCHAIAERERPMEIRYALVKELPGLEYDDAVARATELLADEGFGVLTEIDVKATLKKKLGVDFQRYIILGACNPQLAHRAMSGEPFIGVLLPCNVVVMEREGGGSIVAAFKPTAGFSLVDNPEVAPIAEEVEVRLRRVLARLG
jgi:uncharacterized protein (DUF302 family)